MDDANPYASPKTPAEAPSRRGFRWRIVFSALLIVFGAPLALCSLLMLGFGLVSVWLGGDGLPAEMLFGALLHVVAGLVWLASGIAIWRRKWWRGILGFVVGYVFGVGGAYLTSIGVRQWQ